MANSSKDSLTFPNKKEEIIHAAGKIMSQKGFAATTIYDIATEVGMLKGSLYHYFSSKEDIFFEVINKGIDQLYSKAQEIHESNETPPDKLRRIIKIHALHLMNNNESMVVFLQERNKMLLEHVNAKYYITKRDGYEEFIRNILMEGKKDGYFPKEIHVKLTSFFILGMLNWIIQWYRSEGNASADSIAEYMEFLICDLMLKQ